MRRLLRTAASAGLVLGALMAIAPAASAQATPDCGYGTDGPSASSLCWFDMTDYDDALARSVAGQPMSIDLPGGYTASFTLTSRPVTGVPNHQAIEDRTTPLENRFAFGSTGADGGYRSVPGRPALYSFGGAGGVALTLSNIAVVDSAGQPVTGYRFAIADAENNIGGEDFTWTSDQPLDLIGILNDDAPAGCNAGVPLSGLGTTTVVCDGSGGEPGPPNPNYDAVVVGADTPTTIGLAMTTFARSGIAFAIQTSKIQVTKSVVGRVRPTDSFDVTATSPEGTDIATASTGPANSATTGELTVLPRVSGTSYTLSEVPTPASGTRQVDYDRSWACTNNGAPDPSLPSGSGPSVSVSPAAGDDIECTVTNTQLPADVSIVKSDGPDPVQPGTNLTYTLDVANGGPSRATNVTVGDALPAPLTLVSATPSQGTCNAANPVSCDLGILDSGDSAQVVIVATVDPAASSIRITNTATVTAAEPDSDTNDNTSTTDTLVPPISDLELTKTAPPGPFASGAQVPWSFTVTNDGPNDSPATTVTDTLPAALSYVSDDAGCTVAGRDVTCNLGTLPAGASRTFTVVTQLGTATGAGLTNQAQVSGPNIDSDTTDNASAATAATQPPPTTPAGDDTLCFFGTKVTILGTNEPETIVGTPGRDVINGRRGKDTILGLEGDDLICGGRGDDLIKGGIGDDRVKGSLGDDRIRGNLGDDWLRGAPGDDVITGRRGNDRLMGNDGDDRLRGRQGDDTLLGGPGTDWGHGGPGDDRGLSLATAFSVGGR
jgi:uncharacterized repeat protein (TIGR01451 family)